MDGFTAPWCVAGGWSIDLFLDRVTRPHHDVELAIFREDQSLLRRHLGDWSFEKIVDGRREPWASGEWLALPVHEIHGHTNRIPALAIEFLLNECDASDWVFRRNPAVGLPLARAIVGSESRLPVLNPAIVLLYKAKSARPKDEADFAAARDALDAGSRAWLAAALRTCYPAHPWLDRL
jgi:hypothetical protein